ncbi:ribokinase [Halorussus litoreus]|uniref:ribokinase n=1 Tax=Halorussus litoreus TaxID=1710536 RepID=UPI000E253BED|nr:ribokinase [Halorussus litoreus]
MTTEKATVAVVGSYNHGLTMSVPDIPVPGETVLGSDFEEGVGGKGSNQAVAAARLGADATFVGRIGDDRFGDDAVALWDEAGVDAAVERVPGEHTGVGFVVVEQSGENAIAVAPGANAHLDGEAVRAERQAIADAAESGAATDADAGAPSTEVVLNPAPARELPAEILSDVDVLTPNRTEANMLLGHPPDAERDPAALARELLERGPSAVVLTLGADGALVVTGEQETRVPPADVDVVDTTGAGDAFNAGFAVARGEGASLVEAAAFGCRAGGLACTAYEVVPALPEREAVDRLAGESQ